MDRFVRGLGVAEQAQRIWRRTALMLVSLVEALIVLLALIGCGFWLKGRGVLADGDARTLSRIVTDLILQALIFSSISRHEPPTDLAAPLIMFSATAAALAAAWLLGSMCRLRRPQLGALILVSGIGSSSTVGYTLIAQMFPGNAEAAFDAVMVGELGAIVPLFVVGVPIASYFGGGNERPRTALLNFLRSPMFYALALALVAALVGVPENWLTRLLYRVLDTLGSCLPLLVALTVGLMLRRVHPTRAWNAVLIAGSIKLLLEPLLAAELAALVGTAALERDVLLVEAAMPSGALAAIIAGRYGCDGAFASALVVLTYAASLATAPMIVALASAL